MGGSQGSGGAGVPAHTMRPYLVRAVYEWALDHALTPQILVDAGCDGVEVPATHVRGGRIVLNIHPQAVSGLELGNETLACEARFGGRPFALVVPVHAVLAVYTREHGRGIAFQDELPGPAPGGQAKPARPGPPNLTLVR